MFFLPENEMKPNYYLYTPTNQEGHKMTQQDSLVPFSLEQRTTLSGVGLRSLFKLEDTLSLTEAEVVKILGRPSKTEYKEWKRSALAKETVILPSDALNRVRAFIIVCHQVSVRWPKNPEKVASWLKTPHSAPIFQKKSPLVMMGEVDINHVMNVVRYVETFSNTPDPKKATPKPVRRKTSNH
jgi:hypothetical protein